MSIVREIMSIVGNIVSILVSRTIDSCFLELCREGRLLRFINLVIEDAAIRKVLVTLRPHNLNPIILFFRHLTTIFVQHLDKY